MRSAQTADTDVSGFKQTEKVLDKRYNLPLRTYFSQKARLKLYNKYYGGASCD